MLTKSNTIQLYDVFPKVVPTGLQVDIRIRRMDTRLMRNPQYVKVSPVNRDHHGIFSAVPQPLMQDEKDANLFHVVCTLPDEQGYQLRIFDETTDKLTVVLNVYALDDDLLSRTPLMGDMHSHTSYSDGKEAPSFMAAEYRKNGYDFLTITDHRRYAPSGIAAEAYAGLDLPFCIYRGEEVHAPGNYVHIVNFGADHSVNALALAKTALEDWRDTSGNEVWLEKVKERAKSVENCPVGVAPEIIAGIDMIAEEIRSGGGLCILAHPHWLVNVRNVCDALTEKLLGEGHVDALELIGGQSWYENQTQVAMYYDLVRRGIDPPIVGSSDSHGTLHLHIGEPHAQYSMFTEERTLVFAERNTRDDIVSAVKEHMTLAVEMYKGQYPRFYGPYRLVQYAVFLWQEYFPLREELYFEEGRLMHEYAAGVPGAGEKLSHRAKENAYFEEKYILR